MVPRLIATSATIIPCGGKSSPESLSIPVKSKQQSDEGMSLIVQLGTTSVGYTPTLTTAVVSSGGSVGRSVSFRPQSAVPNSQQPPLAGVAKHRLPMQINRQPPQVNRSVINQQHAALPVRNIATLARPVQHAQAQSTVTMVKAPPQQSAPSPTIAGRVLASPVKDSTLDDDLLEGVVEKRPKYHKHLPLNYQYVLQDHNYGAPPPPTPNSPTKSLVNGVSTANGLTRNLPPVSQQTPNLVSNIISSNRVTKNVQQPNRPTTFGSTTMSNVFGIGTRLAAATEESDVDSTDGEREVDPQGEETETAPEGEDNEDDSVTRCICDMQHDDGYMICCDKCLVWQHVDCMGIDRSNIPDEYLCEKCQPRRIDKQKAVALQLRKKKELIDTDSSSDTSSSSDANIPVRKTNSVNNRRRSEPAQRKNSISISAKQRRESTKESRQNRQVMRKKQIEKRAPPVRRKSSQPPVTNSVTFTVEKEREKEKEKEKKPVTPTTPVEQLRQWIDSYEEAVTNHYSPELRARIASIKVNGIHSDLKLPSNLNTTPKCRVSLLPSGIKILVACSLLTSNQPLVELRGKYMLCGGGPSNRPPRLAVPPPGPYIFYYKLPRDNTEVCVDAKTYGNDARFIRRSCKPNAVMRHCIEKGALHLYLVTTKPVEKNTEITLAVGPGLTCVLCGENCNTGPLSPKPKDKSILNGMISPVNNNDTQIFDKRRRGRRRTMSENLTPFSKGNLKSSLKTPKSQPPIKVSPTPKPISKVVPSVRVPTPPPRIRTPSPEPVVERIPTPPPPTPPPPIQKPRSPTPPPLAPTTRSAASNAARKPFSSPKKEISLDVSCTTRQQKKEAADKKNKMTREERKMEAIMKAFERMEKDQARRQEAQSRQTHRDDEGKDKPEPREDKDQEKLQDKAISPNKEEIISISKTTSVQRKRKFSVSKRKGRGRSQSTPQPVLRPRRTLRRNQSTRNASLDLPQSSDEEISSLRSTPRTPSSEARHSTTPPSTPTSLNHARGLLVEYNKQSFDSPPRPQMNTSSSSGETPPTPMSKTAMLVAAAVGPLAPGFKFPKTKKGLISSWLKSPESSPTPLSEDLVTRGQGFGATKKRWLRQAISEECDSPTSRLDVSDSPTEPAAPPKKRRLARESISEDRCFTPPTTPIHNPEALSQCGSSLESEGPDSPAPASIHIKIKAEVKDEKEEESEESESENNLVKKEATEKEIKEEAENNEVGVKHMVIKGEKDSFDDSQIKGKDSFNNSNQNENKKASASATKRKLSISEYRQRKQQGSGSTGQGSSDKPDHQTSPNTSATSSLSSSSSEDEDDTPAVITKSLLLEAALDTNLTKKPGSTPLFDSAPTLVERQRENLTQRLKREFGLFLSDDEDQDKSKRQGKTEVKEKDKEISSFRKKNALPPPPPTEPPHYPLFFPGVGHPMYNSTSCYPPTTPATLVEPTSASSYYTASSSYYTQLPH